MTTKDIGIELKLFNFQRPKHFKDEINSKFIDF